MWKPIYQPEPWSQYLKKKENTGVPLMEVRKKYMEEQLLFENYMSSIQQLNALSAGSSNSSGGGENVSSERRASYPQEELWVDIDLDRYLRVNNPDNNLFVSTSLFNIVLPQGRFNDELEDTENGLYWVYDDNWFDNNLKEDMSVTIDWGDGNIETVTAGGRQWQDDFDNPIADPPVLSNFTLFDRHYHAAWIPHVYDTPGGQYTVKVKGDAPLIQCLEGGFSSTQYPYPPDTLNRLRNYSQNWGAIVTDYPVDTRQGIRLPLTALSTMGNTLYNDDTGVYTTVMDWAHPSIISYVQGWADRFNGYDHSMMLTMEYLFAFMNNYAEYFPDIGEWDTSNVRNMYGTFVGAIEVPDGIRDWDVSGVGSFRYCFGHFNGFGFNEQYDLAWALADPVTAFKLEQVADWDLASAVRINNMFSSNPGLTESVFETIITAWANNPNTADSVDAGSFISDTPAAAATYPVGGAVDLAVQALTAKGWTISGVTIA
jgi:hypothetical protein